MKLLIFTWRLILVLPFWLVIMLAYFLAYIGYGPKKSTAWLNGVTDVNILIFRKGIEIYF